MADEGTRTSGSGGSGDRDGLRPPGEPVDNGEKVRISLTDRERADQVDVEPTADVSFEAGDSTLSGACTSVRQPVNGLEDPLAPLLGNDRTGRACGDVAEDREPVDGTLARRSPETAVR